MADSGLRFTSSVEHDEEGAYYKITGDNIPIEVKGRTSEIARTKLDNALKKYFKVDDLFAVPNYEIHHDTETSKPKKQKHTSSSTWRETCSSHIIAIIVIGGLFALASTLITATDSNGEEKRLIIIMIEAIVGDNKDKDKEDSTEAAATQTQVPNVTPNNTLNPLDTATPINITRTPVTPQSPELPPVQQIPSGGTFQVTGEYTKWGWICRGDLEVTAPISSLKQLYDEGQNSRGEDSGRSGLITVIAFNSNLTLYAQWGGACEPQASVENLEERLPYHIRMLLNEPGSCDTTERTCSSVNIVNLDTGGKVINQRVCPGDNICP